MKQKLNENYIFELKDWNKIGVKLLEEFYAENYSIDSFVCDIVDLIIQEPDFRSPATWILKHHLERVKYLEAEISSLLAHNLEIFQTWDQKLHLLQCFEYMELREEDLVLVENFVRNCLQDKNKFTRAWAIHGFFILTNIIPEYRQELMLICNRALEFESPAIKAKARHILKKLE